MTRMDFPILLFCQSEVVVLKIKDHLLLHYMSLSDFLSFIKLGYIYFIYQRRNKLVSKDILRNNYPSRHALYQIHESGFYMNYYKCINIYPSSTSVYYFNLFTPELSSILEC